MASAWVPPGDQLRQTWPHLGRQIWSVGARQEVFALPNCTPNLRPRPPHPHHGRTYFYWWFLCLEVLVGEVAVQPSTILASHRENQLQGIDSPTEAVAATAPQYKHPDTQLLTSEHTDYGQKQDVDKMSKILTLDKKETSNIRPHPGHLKYQKANCAPQRGLCFDPYHLPCS